MPFKFTWSKVVVALLVLAVAGFGAWTFWERSAYGLAFKALNAGDSEDRVAATVELSTHEGSGALAHLRHIAEETDDADVKAAAIRGLGNHSDAESIPLFLKAMASESESIRQSGFVAAQRCMDMKKIDYRPDYPQAKRDAALAKLREAAKN